MTKKKTVRRHLHAVTEPAAPGVAARERARKERPSRKRRSEFGKVGVCLVLHAGEHERPLIEISGDVRAERGLVEAIATALPALFKVMAEAGSSTGVAMADAFAVGMGASPGPFAVGMGASPGPAPAPARCELAQNLLRLDVPPGPFPYAAPEVRNQCIRIAGHDGKHVGEKGGTF